MPCAVAMEETIPPKGLFVGPTTHRTLIGVLRAIPLMKSRADAL